MGEYPEALELVHITPSGVIVLQVDQAALAVERRRRSPVLGDEAAERRGGDR